MSDRFKYSTNGVYRIENFAQHLAQNTFPRVPVGVTEGLDCYICMFIRNNGDSYPLIICRSRETFTLQYFFNVIKKDGSSSFKTYGRRTSKPSFHCCSGLVMSATDLLNLENGYLDDETLTIEYGFHIDGFSGKDGIWKFRFSDTFSVNEDVLAIEYYSLANRKVFYAPKQLLAIHNPQFKDQNVKISAGLLRREPIEKCLQMAHGVRIQLDEGEGFDRLEFFQTLMIADRNQLRNVIEYGDQQLVKKYGSPWEKLSDSDLFESCIWFGLRHLLAHLVKHFTCVTELKDIVQKLDIEKMSGEAMKTFTAKIFKLGT